MLSRAGRIRAIVVCAALAGCGRIGVYPIPEIELSELDDAEPPLDDGGSEPLPGDPPMDAGPEAGVMDAGADAAEASTPAQDASAALDAISPAQDANIDAQDGAGASDAPAEASLPACSGARVLGLCWYLGAAGESCQQTCASRGGYDSRTAGLVGPTSQGGSVDNCSAVVRALGHNTDAADGTRADGIGIGCHLWGADAWWLHDGSNLDPSFSAPQARIACACSR